MSTTVQGLIDRVFREYLEPMDYLNSYTVVATGEGFTDSATTITFDGDLLTQEEEDAMDAGAIIECEQELMRCTSLDTVNNQVTVVRAAQGTTAAEHLAGKIIKISPTFTRKSVFDAICDQVENLYPTLFAVDTQSFTSGTGYNTIGTYDAPGTHNYLVAPLKAMSQYTDWSAGSDQTGLKYKGVAVEMIDLPNPFTYTDDTGTERTITYTSGPDVVHALQFVGIQAGHTIFVTFKKKFIAPTAESDTLATIGLESEYEPIIMAGVSAHLIAGRDMNLVDSSYITDQLEAATFPVGSSSSVRNSLLQYQQILIQQARTNLRSKYPEPVQLNSINYPS